MADQVKVLLTQNELQVIIVALERAGVGQGSSVLWETYYDNANIKAAQSSCKKLRSALTQFQAKIVHEEENDSE